MKSSNSHYFTFKQYIDFLPVGLMFVDLNGSIMMINHFFVDLLSVKKEDLINQKADQVIPDFFSPEWIEMPEQTVVTPIIYNNEEYLIQKRPFVVNGKLSGIILILQVSSEITKVFNEYKYLSMDLQAIFENSYDVIFVTDGKGKTLRVSSACEKLWGLKEEDLVGKSTFDLEKEGIFTPSVARLVLERKEKVSCIQTTKTGRRLMVVGTPIKNEEGQIVRVVNASRDITEISKLQSELESLKQVAEGYRSELMNLREQDQLEKKLIYKSLKMKEVVSLSRKIGKVNSAVLVLGESGVGKKVLASHIHKWSKRYNQPFITVNCAYLPDKMLEIELFGYRGDEDSDRKLGLIELANNGTLFIDKIDQMPLEIQLKLLRVLSENEYVPIGEHLPKKVDVRVIAATTHDLKKDVEQGKFRADLYYRLNVIPIKIPPLRERSEDILPLTLHFVNYFNKKYEVEKKLSPKIIDNLLNYNWPGNVRELQNVIERLIVTTDQDVINPEHLPEQINFEQIGDQDISVKNIMPLKDAIDKVEKQLLEMAQKKYGSTTRIAKALGVNQSTVSRKLNKFR